MTSLVQTASASVWNLPNQITVARLVISVLLFVSLAQGAFVSALVLFILAAGTDWVDGYLARKYQLVTQLGRILDPFADKLLILGTFTYLAAYPASGVGAWVAVVVLARELLVTALRSFLEQKGHDFSATMAGKLKMVFQCALTVASLMLLAQGATAPWWLPRLVTFLCWITVASTIQSGWAYISASLHLVTAPDVD